MNEVAKILDLEKFKIIKIEEKNERNNILKVKIRNKNVQYVMNIQKVFMIN